MLVNLPCPILKFQHALLPSKCREPQLLSPSIVFTFGLIVESIKELGGASITHLVAAKHINS
jgi:hypothetical protein